MSGSKLGATFLGHSSVLLRFGPTTVLTDPVLSLSLAGLVRRVAPHVEARLLDPPAVVVISHAHYDHLDVRTLRLLSPGYTLVVPRGVGRYVKAVGAGEIVELSQGEKTVVEDLEVVAVRADHDGRRHKLGRPAEALGFVIRAHDHAVYHAGDSAVYSEMAELAGDDIDLALMPVWAGGPRRLDPVQAAEATALVRPAWAIPVHWGTLRSRVFPQPQHRRTQPPDEYAEAVRVRAPDTRVVVLQVTQSWSLPTGPDAAA